MCALRLLEKVDKKIGQGLLFSNLGQEKLLITYIKPPLSITQQLNGPVQHPERCRPHAQKCSLRLKPRHSVTLTARYFQQSEICSETFSAITTLLLYVQATACKAEV